MRRALVIVGKAPRAGSAKTRLVPPLSPDAAALLYRAFLLDTLALGVGLGWEAVTLVHPAGADQAVALEELLPPTVRRAPQTGHGLGDALAGAFASHFREDFSPVVLMASDSPSLPRASVQAAADALATHDISIGPTEDGGYYLIGLRHPCPDVFAHIDWSTPRVLEQTLAIASRLSLRVFTLPTWFDVDGPTDLARLDADLATRPPDVAPHTRAALAELAFAPEATSFALDS
jgi:rSAM/selenodomain-associated transferase 1